jgi:hypothetical protein
VDIVLILGAGGRESSPSPSRIGGPERVA